jgi:hypothetical protein
MRRLDKALVVLAAGLLLCASGSALAKSYSSDKNAPAAAHASASGGTHTSPSNRSHGSVPANNSTGRGERLAWGGGRHGGGDHRGPRGGGGYGGDDGGVIVGYPYYPGPWPYPDVPPYPPAPPPGAPAPGAPAPAGPDQTAATNDTAEGPPPWPFWYYCDQPNGFFPYVKNCEHDWTAIPVTPPPPVSPKPISYASWEWCEKAKGYFPYVTLCPAGWTAVAVSQPASERYERQPSVSANWFYCDAPKGYAPYVHACSQGWRPVPAMPPPNATANDRQAAKGH